MSAFMEWLEERNRNDTRMRAVLRRSMAFEPGSYIPAYPYVEPFIKDQDNVWKRKAYYLVAGLWSMHWRAGRDGVPGTVGKACAIYQKTSRSASIEQRFITFLDSDDMQLPHRIRQMIAMLKDLPIDFDDLLNGLLYWNSDEKSAKKRWARDFYREIKMKNEFAVDGQEEE